MSTAKVICSKVQTGRLRLNEKSDAYSRNKRRKKLRKKLRKELRTSKKVIKKELNDESPTNTDAELSYYCTETDDTTNTETTATDAEIEMEMETAKFSETETSSTQITILRGGKYGPKRIESPENGSYQSPTFREWINQSQIGESNSAKNLSKNPHFSELQSMLSSLNSRVENANSNQKERSMFEMVDLDDCWSAWTYETPQKKAGLVDQLKETLDNHTKANTCVIFGHILFHCQKFILRNAELFRACERKIYTFEKKHEITPTAFAIFYNFSMGKCPVVAPKDILDVLRAAEIMRAHDFNVYCKRKLDSPLYKEDSAFKVLKLAKSQNLFIIERIMVQRIWKFFLPLISGKHFIEMEVDEVCRLLTSNTIGVNSEIEVFYAAILWLNMKWKDRKDHCLEKVMSCIRYSLIPPWFTYSLRKNTRALEINRVIQNRNVSKMITDGASIAATISLYFMDPDKYQMLLQRLMPKIPMQRTWVYDKACIYHYGAHKKVIEAVNYDIFKDYLKMIQMEGSNYWHNFHEGHKKHFTQIFCQKFSNSALSKMQF